MGSSVDHFTAHLLRDIGLYIAINPVEFQLFDANSERIAMSADTLIAQPPYRLGPVPVALPEVQARIPPSQLVFLAEALWNPCIAAGCPPIPDADEEFVPLDPNGLGETPK